MGTLHAIIAYVECLKRRLNVRHTAPLARFVASRGNDNVQQRAFFFFLPLLFFFFIPLLLFTLTGHKMKNTIP